MIVFYNRNLLAYIFIPLIQKEVDIFQRTIWNTHRIRAQKDTLLPAGIPNHMYDFPEEYGQEKCGKNQLSLDVIGLQIREKFE